MAGAAINGGFGESRCRVAPRFDLCAKLHHLFPLVFNFQSITTLFYSLTTLFQLPPTLKYANHAQSTDVPMTKRVRSDRRPYDIRPVSLIRLDKVQSQDALDNLSRYEAVSRQFAQEFPQMAWNLGQRPWIPCFPSLRYTGPQENRTMASADATSADTSAIRGPACGSEFMTSAVYNLSTHSDDADFNALPTTMTTATMSPAEQPGNLDSLTSPDTGFDPSCGLEALTSQFLWQNYAQESCYNRAMQMMQNRNEDQMQGKWDEPCLMASESLFTQPVEQGTTPSSQRDSSDVDDEALAENSCVGRNKINQIIIDLNQLGNRLREDARRQLDTIITGGVMGDDRAALPMCL